ncbi:TMV resistance protein N-like [Ziziphus jujuba]|uniref:TMV resistance protein N-like n=1 Tax=Ziziphus jujuba TaxID=326968 RepID=A0ABM4ABB9_ZIZJJ|nr:TMV resistance protein N-like [Ziziphus jujuba]
MATKTVSSSSSSSRKYDVFLSFRGDDTRLSFTDHLYKSLSDKGIYTFRDDKKLQKGTEVAPELLKAIEGSRFAIVILSKDYASSTWCLVELAKIVECKKELGLIVLPVFYHVEPKDVKEQTGEFGEAFAKHYKTDSEDDMRKVKEWREALTEVASSIEGWHIKERHETEVIEEIVKVVEKELNLTFSTSNNGLVGMASRIMKMHSLLNNNQLEVVLTVGIWGMAGIGKTTIAEQVKTEISHKFDASAFIPNVREEFEKNGIIYLQNLLYKCLLNLDGNIQHVQMGRNALRNRLCSKKVLIILDDVDELEQIEDLVGNAEEQHRWLGPGSRVIVTTKDKDLLKTYGENNIYKVGTLTHDEALQLFSRRAFKRKYPFDDFIKLSYDFVEYANHHPLALKVLGSLLFGKNVDQWSDTLVKLKRNPDRKVTRVLQVSYDGLDDDQKKIFLDIACFFKGEEEYRVEKILEGCGLCPRTDIRLLVDKSLINIIGNRLWMHDLLQQFGQYIVHREFPEEPGKYSRIWHHEDAYNVLVNNTGTEAVQGIFLCLPKKEKLNLRVDPILQMKMLRLLKFRNVDFPECVGCLSNELRLLEWHGYPQKSIPSSFCPRKLVELNMSSSHIERLWKETTHELDMLISINLSHCVYLNEIPDLNRVPNLERLILEGCKVLSKVHSSIGELKKLVLLNLKGCESLKSICQGINLGSLETFILSGCTKLTKFPEILGNMDRLSELYLDGTAIKELPTSIERLSGLTLLNLRDCKNLLKLPDELCSLTSLQALDISECSHVEQLPENIGRLEQLEKLDASRTAIREPSPSIRLLKNLKVLRFSGCSGVAHIPRWSVFGCCLLPMEESIQFQLPHSLYAHLTSLTSLSLRKCNLPKEGIAEEIHCLSSLGLLDLSENDFVSLPDTISQLFNLGFLFLEDCKRLEWLPKLPLSLKHAYVHGCPLLKNSKDEIWTSDAGFTFIHYQNSNQFGDSVISNQELFEMLYSKTLEEIIYSGEIEKIGFDCRRIPEWWSQYDSGYLTGIRLPLKDTGKTWMGFASFAVFQIRHGEMLDEDGRSVACFHFDTNERHLGLEHFVMDNSQILRAGIYGVWIYVPRTKFEEQLNNACYVTVSVSAHESHLETYMCGMHIVFNKDMPDFSRNIAQILSNESTFLTYINIRKPIKAAKFETPRGAIEIQSFPHNQVKQEDCRRETESDLSKKTRRDLQWLVPILVQRCYAHNYCFAFHFSLKAFPTWFFHHSASPFVVCDLPMNLFGDKPWVGFCLYVLLAWPDNYVNSQTPLHLKFEFLVYGDNGDVFSIKYKIAIKHKLLLLNMPRVYMEAVLNQCPGVRALFRTSNPDVEVEMCGIRPVNEQDVGNIIQLITGITLSSGHFCYEEFGQLFEESPSAVEFVEPEVEIPIDFDYYERQVS